MNAEEAFKKKYGVSIREVKALNGHIMPESLNKKLSSSDRDNERRIIYDLGTCNTSIDYERSHLNICKDNLLNINKIIGRKRSELETSNRIDHLNKVIPEFEEEIACFEEMIMGYVQEITGLPYGESQIEMEI